MAMFRALPRVYDEICPALPGPETQDSTPDSVKLLHIADRSKSHSGGTQTWPLAGRICPALPGPETQDSLPSAMVKTKKLVIGSATMMRAGNLNAPVRQS